ncbi:CpaD family pilus assembly protein [Lichenibacterium ramalinae]|uniref:Pilus assembly protein CpaD n=1 Tax=Lichenibacterium ramalinae TaxID=2316527 RepID=A0A4Q2RI68_9HYPH|nr:CpaD family pilus assembly protein [Lichenibacterium ramalinae]RYB07664.1 pilus assembly protein CpaD [Lichenibacterium ramalinae]
MTAPFLPALPTRRHAAAAALFAVLALPVAGCSHPDRAVATSAIPADYHERHPVALVNARQAIDIFLIGVGGQLDYRQKHDLEAFSADYRAHGEGLIQVLVPRGPGNAHAADATLTAVRRGLAASGVTGDIEVGSYVTTDAKLASVLRVSFVKLQARAASRCGDWPSDLASGSSTDGWENRTYYNLGCATQQTLAAQMDDPRDLVRPRAEDPSDVVMRTRAIKDLRGDQTSPTPLGLDPSTSWTRTSLSPIGAVGNN